MTEWAPRLLEVTSFGLVAWCLADAWRRGPQYMAELLAGALFGLCIEQAIISRGGALGRPDVYRYGAFTWLATPDVPLVVVACWGALLYAGMKYSDSLGIPASLRPAVDGLYALVLDLTMDPVAIRLGLWQWQTPAGSQWQGVPFSNFGGWLVLAAIFSAAVRAVRALTAAWPWPARVTALPVLVGPLVLATLAVFGHLFTGGEADAWTTGLLALLAAALLARGLLWRRQATPVQLRAALAGASPPLPWFDPAVGLPVCWHLSFLGAAALTGIFADQPAALFLTGALASAGTLLAIGLLPVTLPD